MKKNIERKIGEILVYTEREYRDESKSEDRKPHENRINGRRENKHNEKDYYAGRDGSKERINYELPMKRKREEQCDRGSRDRSAGRIDREFGDYRFSINCQKEGPYNRENRQSSGDIERPRTENRDRSEDRRTYSHGNEDYNDNRYPRRKNNTPRRYENYERYQDYSNNKYHENLRHPSWHALNMILTYDGTPDRLLKSTILSNLFAR